MDLIDYFTGDLKPRQKQYEAIRAVAFKEGGIGEVAPCFGYTPQSLRTLINRLEGGRHVLFPEVKRGPKGRHTSDETVTLIYELRRKRKINAQEIARELDQLGISLGVRTVERILADAGFPRLRRRTNKEKGLSKTGTLITQRSANLDIKELQPFQDDCQVAGIFLFIPYILESGILDVVEQCALPESNDIGKRSAALSMLLLKLIGNERLSHIDQFNMDHGFGLFSGLNVPPKPSYMCSYSCRTTAAGLMKFQRELISNLSRLYPELYAGKTINLDFHSIPHFGTESEMEKVWCGARGKTMKGANTFFAQDGKSDSLIYTRADIKRSESSDEIRKFVDYWVGIKGIVDETLVFDSKLTNYNILYDLDKENVKFITLRRRGKKLIEYARNIPEEEWEKVYLPIPKRKYKHVKVFEERTELISGRGEFRHIIIKDHGRVQPTFIVSNNEDMELVDILMVYARRWHIENKLSDLVHFFSINALSSPIMIRIHFDILWTVVADTLYHLLARDLRRFENCRAPKLFKRFIDMPGRVKYDGERFTVKIRKRATTPILLGVEKLNKEVRVPWLGNKPLKVIWTP